MEEEQKQHLSVVDASGFPLQMAVVAHIRSSDTAWQPIAIEHPWKHPETQQDGYIDVLLQNQVDSSQIIVAECKRQRGDARWYFLDLRPDTRRVRYLGTPESGVLGVYDGAFFPSSPEATFCILQGEDAGRRPTLERIADDLLQSVEAFAAEQLKLDSVPIFRYLPTVITNARLFLCEATATGISLETGTLPESATFHEAPFVRFRKTLWASAATEPAKARDMQQAHRARERTILVVSARCLLDFLGKAQFVT